MNKKLCVYTCITNNYDQIHEIKNVEKDVDYYCFTNNKDLCSKTWKIIYIENGGLNDHQLSRKIKMLGHPLISKNYDISLWMDASVVWRESIKDFVKEHLKSEVFAAFRHSIRDTIKDEAIACCKLRKDSREKIEETLSFLKKENFPDNVGLHEMTVFIKKHNDPVVKKTMELWFKINCNYSKRDQLSFEYSAWKNQLKLKTINLNMWNNEYFYHIPHNNENTIKDCAIYFGNSSSNFTFDRFYTYDYAKKCNTYSIKCKIPVDTDRIEIYPSEAIGIVYNNVHFSPSPKSQTLPESLPHDNGYMLYDANALFCYAGDFKAGEDLCFSFDAKMLNRTELFYLFRNFRDEVRRLSADGKRVHELEEIQLQNSRKIDMLENELSLIHNSRSYRYAKEMSKIVNKIIRRD